MVDPDAAVAQLEELSAILKGLSQDELRAFLAFTQERAGAEARKPQRREYAEFLRRFPEDAGLLE